MTTAASARPRIIAPIDFSDASNQTLVHAEKLARNSERHLVLLHVQPIMKFVVPDFVTTESTESLSNYHSATMQRLAKLADTLTVDSKSIFLEVVPGSPAHAIVEFVRETDLLVMSTHGRTGAQRMLMGSVTEQVARHAPCSVLIVRGSGIGDLW